MALVNWEEKALHVMVSFCVGFPHTLSAPAVWLALFAIPIGWPGLIGKCRSIFLRHSHLSLTGRFGKMESTLRKSRTRSRSRPRI